MNDTEAVALHTSMAAQRILSAGAQRLSASLDHFSGWLLAGFGALFGLLIANFGSLERHLSIFNLQAGAVIFLISACLAALQKFIAVYLQAGASAGEDGRSIAKELVEREIPVDVPSMYREVKKGLFWPFSRINEWMTAKAENGDVAVVGRHHAEAAQLQFWLVVIQSGFSIAAGFFVVAGLSI